MIKLRTYILEKLKINKNIGTLKDKCYIIPFGDIEDLCKDEYGETQHINNLYLYGYIVDKKWLKKYFKDYNIKKLDIQNPNAGETAIYDIPDKYYDINTFKNDLEEKNIEVEDLKRIININDL